MTLDLHKIYPSEQALDAYIEGREPCKEFKEMRGYSYARHHAPQAFKLAIIEGNLDVFVALVNHHLPRGGGKLPPKYESFILPETGLHYHNFYRYDTPERHESFTVPAIRYLFKKNAVEEMGLNNLLNCMIQCDDKAMGRETLAQIKQNTDYEFHQYHWGTIARHHRPEWIPLLKEEGYPVTFAVLKDMVKTRGEDEAAIAQHLPALTQDFSKEEVDGLLQHVNSGIIMKALVENVGASIDWADAKGKGLMSYLTNRPKQASGAIEYLNSIGSIFRHKADATLLHNILAAGDGARMIGIVVNSGEEVSVEAFNNAARFAGATPAEFYKTLPDAVRNNKYLSAVRIELIQTSAAKQAHQLGDTRDKANHAPAERESK